MKRILKKLSVVVLLLLLLVFVFAYWAMSSQKGSRWLFNQVIGHAGLPVKYHSFNGAWNESVTITGLNLDLGSDQLMIDQLSLGDWQLSFFPLSLALDDVQLSEVNWRSSDATLNRKESAESLLLPSFEWPFPIHVNQFRIDGLLTSGIDEQTQWGDLNLQALFSGAETRIKAFQWRSQRRQIEANGAIQHGEQWTGEGSLNWTKTDNDLKVSGEGDWRIQNMNITIAHALSIETPSLEAQGSLELGVDVIEEQFALSSNWKIDPQGEDSIHLRTQVNGLFDAFDVSAKLNGFPDWAPKSFTGQVSQVEDSWTLREGQLDQGWQLAADLTDGVISLNLLADEIDAGQWDAELSSDLSLKMTAHLDTRQSQPLWTIDEAQAKGTFNHLPANLTIKGHGTESDWNASIKADLNGQVLTSNVISKKGMLSSSGQAKLTQLQSWVPELSGFLTGSWDLQTDGDKITGRLDFSGKAIQLGELAVKHVELFFDHTTTRHMALSATLEAVEWNDFSFVKMDVFAEGDWPSFEFRAETESVLGLLTMSSSIGIDPSQNKLAGELTQLNISSKGKNAGWQLRSPTFWSFQDHVTTIKNLCLDAQAGEGYLCWKPIQNKESQLAFQQVELSDFQALLPQGLNLSGSISGEASTNDGKVHLRVKGESLSFNPFDWELPSGWSEWTAVTAEVDYAEGHWVHDWEAKSKTGHVISGKGEVALENEWFTDSRFSVQSNDHGWLVEMWPELKQLTGELAIDGVANGLLLEPDFEIGVSLEKGAIGLSLGPERKRKKEATPIEFIHAQWQGSGVKNQRIHLKASIDGQVLEAEGRLRDLMNPQSHQWSVKGEDMLLWDDRQVKVVVRPDVEFDGQTQSLKGDLSIVSGHLVLKDMKAGVVTLSSDVQLQTVLSENQSKFSPSVNLAVQIQNPLKLDVMGIQGHLNGQLQLTKEHHTDDWKANGVLSLADGLFEMYGQKLNLVDSHIHFKGDPEDPELDIKAERVVAGGNQTVGVKISGTVNNITTELYSDPVLSEAETLVYLATGNAIKDFSETEDGTSMTNTLLALGLQNNSQLMKNLKKITGFDDIQIKNEQGQSLVVEAGKQISDQFYVGVKQGVLDEVTQWMMRYQINDKWSVESQQGSNQEVKVIYRRKKR